ncbi:MAG: hypothetical protein QW840_02310 [Candidatus Bathyarchaeia archaeon]
METKKVIYTTMLIIIIFVITVVALVLYPKPVEPEPEPPLVYNTLTMLVSGEGSTFPPAGTHTYQNGTIVTISAITPPPTSQYYWRFEYWDLGNNEKRYVNTTSVLMDRNRTITAYFKKVNTGDCKLLVFITPHDSGTVDIKNGTYPSGYLIVIFASPKPGWKFDHWIGVSGANPASFFLETDMNITAVFSPVP